MNKAHELTMPASPQPSFARRNVARTLVPERPVPQFLVALVAFFVLPVAMIPATKGEFVRIPPLPYAWWTIYFMMAFGGIAALLRLLLFSRPIKRTTLFGFMIPFFLMGGWQMMSLLWNQQTMFVRWYSFLQSLAMWAAVLGGACLISGLSFRSRIKVVSGITFLFAFVLFVYASLSFVFPSLRPSTAWMDRTAEGLGFIRIFGPLGKATTLNFVIVPALGFSIGMFYMKTPGRPVWLMLALFFIGCIISTGSRGGLMSLMVFGVIMLLWGRLRAALIILPVIVGLVGLVAIVGVPERFKTLDDGARVSTYKAGLAAYTDNPKNFVLGVGHGHLYTKLHDDTVRKQQGQDRWYLLDHRTEFGYSLRNSHSAILRSLVETGPLGLLLTVVPLLWLLARPISRSYRLASQPHRMMLRSSLAGAVAVLPYCIFEEFFISAFWVVLLWTIYALSAAEGVDETAVA